MTKRDRGYKTYLLWDTKSIKEFMKKNNYFDNHKYKYMDTNPIVHMMDVILGSINSIQLTGENFKCLIKS